MATKKQHESLNKEVDKIMKGMGAIEPGRWSYKYTVKTKAGELHVTTHDPSKSPVFSIYCRFESPDNAKPLVSDDTRLNPYSGKWNFHGYDKDVLIRHFTNCLKQIL